MLMKEARKAVENYGNKWRPTCAWINSARINCYQGVLFYLKENEYFPCICNIDYPLYLLQEQRKLEEHDEHNEKDILSR